MNSYIANHRYVAVGITSFYHPKIS